MRRITPLVVGGLVGLGAMEVAVRNVYDISTTYDPVLGDVVMPGTTVHWAREGHATSRWTEHGVRRQHPPDANKPSVIAYGDSFTEALMVDDDGVFTAQAEARLEAAGIELQVLNVGHASRSLADYIDLAPRYDELFHPKWTILELRDEDVGADAWTPARTHFSSTGGLHVEVVAPTQHHGMAGLLWRARQHSMLVGYAAVRAGEFLRATADEPPLFRAGSARAPAKTKPEMAYPIEDELDMAAAIFHGRVTILFLAEYDPHTPTRVTETERRVFDYCALKSLSCVDTRTYYDALPSKGVAPFGFPNTEFNSGHINALGHSLAATALTSELTSLRSRALL